MSYLKKNNQTLSVRRRITISLIVLFVLTTGSGVSQAQKTAEYTGLHLSSQLAVRETKFLSGEKLNKLDKEKSPVAKKSSTSNQLPSQIVAEDFLQNYRGWFGIENVADELTLTAIRKSPAGQHLIYTGLVNDITVHNSTIVISLDNSGAVSFVMSTYRPNLQIATISPRLSAATALDIARDYLKVGGFMHAEPASKLMIFETLSRGAILAYRVRLPVSEPLGDWQLFVDAASGEILELTNALCYQSGTQGSGAVWTPDPLTMAEKYFGDTGYVDNNDQDSDSLNNQRVIVPLYDLGMDNKSGEFTLRGPYININDSLYHPKYKPTTSSDPNGFIYTRSQQEFEDVMVYYHADQCYRRLLDLGFTNTDLAALQADPHGSALDISFYSPFGNFCVFGEGGVDDAEDAAVIWHEYTHAIQRNLSLVNFVGGGETFSLLEGAADYWAASYKRRLSDFEWQQVFLWDAGITADGDTTFWYGRRCDKDWHYPEDYYLYAGTHNGGQIWSSALMNVWGDLGADITDALFLQSHYYWSENPGFVEAAESIIQADRDLFGGSHLAVITYWFDYHGFVNITDYQPRIVHQTHKDSEDLEGPYRIDCQIVPDEAALDPAALWLIWQIDSLAADSARLTATGQDTYMAEIPGSGFPAEITYYLYARDMLGQSVVDPAAAPLAQHRFQTGPDTLAPLVQHTPLDNQLLSNWPAEIMAFLTDNLGIDSAWVTYYLTSPDSVTVFSLLPDDTGLYRGFFLADSADIQSGDSVHYRLIVRDLAANQNQTFLPSDGFFSFAVYQAPQPPLNIQVLDRNDKVLLAWEENKQKVPVYYNIYRSEEDLIFTLLDSTLLPQFTDTTVFLGGTYHYYLTTIFGEWESIPSDTVVAIVEAVVSIDDDLLSPRQFKLGQNYPNPFNPITNIKYELPRTSEVKLNIYNIRGQKVATLISENQPAGVYQIAWNAARFASGVYYYRLQAGTFSQVRKLILLK